MGAVYGIVGDAAPAELEAMGQRLAHRGEVSAAWSPAASIHLGMNGTPAAVERVRDGVIVFDGAIDNRAELARLLKRRPGEQSTSLANLPLHSGTVRAAGSCWRETALAIPRSTSPRIVAASCSPANTRRSSP